MADYQHTSVLQDEIIEFLRPKKNQHFVDATLGGGGHSQAILEKNGPAGKVLAFELDERAIAAAKVRLKKYQQRIIIVRKNYVHLKEELEKNKKDLPEISGVVFDLGLSLDQLLSANRGFSFNDDGPLDMRFDTRGQSLTASDIILNWSEKELLKIFREYGEVKQAQRLARGLVSWRAQIQPKGLSPCGRKQKQKKLKTSMLVSAILRILKISEGSLKKYRIHPATQIFQSLRIAVNGELDNLHKVLPLAFWALKPGGRLAVISFHSLEDRLVKNYFKSLLGACTCPPDLPVCVCGRKSSAKLMTKKPVRPSPAEIRANPRSRSAILRVIEKL